MIKSNSNQFFSTKCLLYLLAIFTVCTMGSLQRDNRRRTYYTVQNDFAQDYLNEEEEINDINLNSDESSSGSHEIWAILVAGSNGFYNYRHQADVFHAYNLLLRNGIKRSHIITFAYDDIAYDEENPTPGIIINRPNGTNVYEGVIIDYKGEDVKPENFLKVLLGDEEGMRGVGSGKVLKSGERDYVFINFVDHGAPGLVAFPNDELHASKLEKTFQKMHKRKMYEKMVFYLEACESGSMFKNILPDNLNIYAVTAANSEESSYACYFDNLRETYLGDVFSVNWLEDSDSKNLKRESLQKQFLIVQKETNTSHVMEFGDESISAMPAADFLGFSKERLHHPQIEMDTVESVDVPRLILEKKFEKARTTEEKDAIKRKLDQLHKMRKFLNDRVTAIVDEFIGNDTAEKTIIFRERHELLNFSCYEKAAKFFSKNCFSIAKNSYATRKLYIFVNACERGWSSEAIIEAMANTCQSEKLTGII